MTNVGLSGQWCDYSAVIREDAHQLLAWGYNDSRPMLLTAADEYEMTGFLSDAMHRRTIDDGVEERFSWYAIKNEMPFSPAGELGKKRPKLDILVERCGRPKRVYTFEAKRLRDDDIANLKKSLGDYLGSEGIGRFISDYYARESDEAAMIALIQAHDPGFWIERLVGEFKLDADGVQGLQTIEMLSSCQVCSDLSHEAVSIHRRNSGNPIRLYHVMLDCCVLRHRPA